MRKVAPLSAMKTVLFAAGQVGLVEVGRADDEELVEEEFEYETVELVDTETDDPDVADAVDEELEVKFSALPMKTAPLMIEFLTGFPALLFM